MFKYRVYNSCSSSIVEVPIFQSRIKYYNITRVFFSPKILHANHYSGNLNCMLIAIGIFEIVFIIFTAVLKCLGKLKKKKCHTISRVLVKLKN